MTTIFKEIAYLCMLVTFYFTLEWIEFAPLKSGTKIALFLFLGITAMICGYFAIDRHYSILKFKVIVGIILLLIGIGYLIVGGFFYFRYN